MIYIILACILYATGLLFGTVASRTTNTNLVTNVINIMTVLVPLTLSTQVLNAKLFAESKTGLLYAIVAGVFIGLFTLALTKSFAVNKVGIVTPIVYGGTILITTITSSILFHEKISRLQFIGLLFLTIGFCIVTYSRWIGK